MLGGGQGKGKREQGKGITAAARHHITGGQKPSPLGKVARREAARRKRSSVDGLVAFHLEFFS